ncbi:MAG: prolipoprotein diacylglyceryl transferase [Phycisphaerae bacterium]|nr:prolipoprotein diacylglyceryl transferase [Phycisphaerae bacterium]
MTFPVIYNILGLHVPAHAVFELAGYAIGFQTFRLIRRRTPSDQRLPLETTVWLIAGAILGAAIGSKVLAWIESWPEYWAVRNDPALWLGGKTIVGGLLGGWIGVEFAKRYNGVRHNTGDAFVLPLLIGIAIGRIGCFLEGLPDHTFGIATNLTWGIDFGDGIHRHPTQLYESFLMLPLGLLIWWRSRWPYERGELFRLFLLGYLLFRLAVEFIKPTYRPYGGLSAIQVASACGIAALIISLYRLILAGPLAGHSSAT